MKKIAITLQFPFLSSFLSDNGIFKSSAKKSNQTLRKVLDIDPQAFKMENQTR